MQNLTPPVPIPSFHGIQAGNQSRIPLGTNPLLDVAALNCKSFGVIKPFWLGRHDTCSAREDYAFESCREGNVTGTKSTVIGVSACMLVGRLDRVWSRPRS
jgi:hypothetical protein